MTKRLALVLIGAALAFSACGKSKAIPSPPSDAAADGAGEGGGEHATSTDASGDSASDHLAADSGTKADGGLSADAPLDTAENADGAGDTGD